MVRGVRYVLQCMDGVPLPFVEAINSAADVPDFAILLQAPPGVTARRVAGCGAHDRFHTGEESSHRECELCGQAAERLARWRYFVLAFDTSGASGVDVATYVAA